MAVSTSFFTNASYGNLLEAAMSYYEMINHEHVSYYPSLDHDFLISSGHWVLQQVVSQ